MAFDDGFKLVALFHSYSNASRIMRVSRQSIVNSVTGKKITCAGMYWREIDSNIIIDSDDLGNLNMLTYDAQLGINYRVYIVKKGKKEIVFENDIRRS